MDPRALTFADAAPHHFDAIARIEREAGGSSLVMLTAGRAIEEAVRRGHYVIVGLDADEVAGWVWFSVDGARGGEEIAQMFRVAVAPERRRSGIGRALVEHAQEAGRAAAVLDIGPAGLGHRCHVEAVARGNVRALGVNSGSNVLFQGATFGLEYSF